MRAIVKRLLEDLSALASLPAYCFLVLLFLFLGRFEIAVDLFVGLVIAYIVTIVTRLIYHRDRPQPRTPEGFLERVDAASFPSLHSYRAALLLIVPLHFRSVELGILFAMLASTVWYTRYALRHHHITDIIAGAALGIATVIAIL